MKQSKVNCQASPQISQADEEPPLHPSDLLEKCKCVLRFKNGARVASAARAQQKASHLIDHRRYQFNVEETAETRNNEALASPQGFCAAQLTFRNKTWPQQDSRARKVRRTPQTASLNPAGPLLLADLDGAVKGAATQ